MAEASAGDADSQLRVARALEKGRGTPKDLTQAMYWYRQAASQELAEAQYSLGVFLANGTGGVRDAAEAKTWYEKAAKQDHALAINNLGVLNQSGQDPAIDLEFSIQCYQRAAALGCELGQFNLGLASMYGHGTAQDNIGAFDCFQKATEQGLVHAQVNLGYCYQKGIGIQPDSVQALRWYRSAAMRNFAPGLLNVGCMYEANRSTAAKAVEMYRRAAEQGLVAAQRGLANLYDRGIGVRRDINLALTWFSRAAERDDYLAQRWLAGFYRGESHLAAAKAQAKYWSDRMSKHSENNVPRRLPVSYRPVPIFIASPVEGTTSRSGLYPASLQTYLCTYAGAENNEDRACVFDSRKEIVLVMADGAGGVRGGEQAAGAVITAVRDYILPAPVISPELCAQTLQFTDMELSKQGCESTAVIAIVTAREIFGASVGDSAAWLVSNDRTIDLTENQKKKPRLGSGQAQPISFRHDRLPGTLLLATDGLINHLSRDQISDALREESAEEAATGLIEDLLGRFGSLMDDTTAIVCKLPAREEEGD
ncbi:MAG: protein phosphatase 2C domain-containing protein [Burkholderiales bacterium]